MSTQPDTDQPQPHGEPIQVEKAERSASQAALQAAETIAGGAGVTLGGLAAKDLYGKAKDKLGGGSKPNDSKD